MRQSILYRGPRKNDLGSCSTRSPPCIVHPPFLLLFVTGQASSLNRAEVCNGKTEKKDVARTNAISGFDSFFYFSLAGCLCSNDALECALENVLCTR